MSSEHQATVDICVHLHSIRNIGETYLNQYYFTLSLNAGQHLAVPYQIIPKCEKTVANISLLEYISPLFSLIPYENEQYAELAVFKALIPLSLLENQELQVNFVLHQLSGSSDVQVDQARLEYDNIIGLNSMMPVCFYHSRCAIDATITTQLLTCRFKNIVNTPKPLLYLAIEGLLISFNRLRERLSKCKEVQKFSIENFPELQDIRKFVKTRIFQGSEEEQRMKLVEFQRKIPNISSCVQQLWSQYLKIELQSDIEKYRNIFLKSFALQVKQKVFMRQNMSELTYVVDGLKLFSYPISIQTVAKKEAESFVKGDGDSQHLIILVHGYGASSQTMEQLQLGLRCFFPRLNIISSRINENKTDDSLEDLGKRLALEVESSIQSFKAKDNFCLSFISHSLGGLIVRSALQYLQQYKYNMKLFVSLGSPHLGYLYHNSKMAKFGMWAYNIVKSSPSMSALMMHNSTGNYRSSYLYELSKAPGLGWFEEVLLYAGIGDYYVCEESALMQGNQSIATDKEKGIEEAIVWQEMIDNMQETLKNVGTSKYLVDFQQQNLLNQGSIVDQFLGRRNHMNLVTSNSFILALLLNHWNLL